MPDTTTRLRGWRLALRVTEEMLVGERPETRRLGPRPPRAARTRMTRVTVDPSGVTRSDRRRREHRIDRSEIGRVALIDVVYRGRGGDVVRTYALVIGPDDVVRLRVVADGPLLDSAATKRRLRELWEPLGVPVARETTTSGLPHDYRRRWPEAFGFVHARPVVTLLLLAAFWMLVVVPILDHTIGS